ncbi:hypothetical protein SODALDRAFT_361863 [Sodiomyces alkalinus F11]|uniref:Uncharacterized protein n=1 Tax=Sodiomyces alkalinus (strain CBS 110278 / VKM F-3762 / F11) TaxID=1314773 RepID=A0A3N2PR74_SODAK|nr:hypothetical protein SODALDRAFT_361863 [Sodiomyces alkalinus F11]ROT37011.1 hypothetical protein SODALDRAFT_361863 [Sodiomyces alkalinus F11]
MDCGNFSWFPSWTYPGCLPVTVGDTVQMLRHREWLDKSHLLSWKKRGPNPRSFPTTNIRIPSLPPPLLPSSPSSPSSSSCPPFFTASRRNPLHPVRDESGRKISPPSLHSWLPCGECLKLSSLISSRLQTPRLLVEIGAAPTILLPSDLLAHFCRELQVIGSRRSVEDRLVVNGQVSVAFSSGSFSPGHTLSS